MELKSILLYRNQTCEKQLYTSQIIVGPFKIEIKHTLHLDETSEAICMWK
jgi:hypothetical protein